MRLSDVFGVSTDYLLGRESLPRLSTEGLTVGACAHLALLIDDLRQTKSKPSL